MKKILIILAMLVLSVPAFAASGTLDLTWDAVTLNADGTPCDDLAGYKVYRSDVPGGPYTNISEVTGLAFSDPFPDGIEETRCYVVTAFDTAGNESDYSNEECAVVDSVKPGAPVLHKLKLTWQ